VRELVTATGFFSPAEVAIATELVETRIAQGPASGYAFLFAETDDRPSGLHLLRTYPRYRRQL
jgi:hypothetical protein